MTSEVLGEMFKGDSADMCAGKFPLVSMGGRAEGIACTDPGARTPISASGNLFVCYDYLFTNCFAFLIFPFSKIFLLVEDTEFNLTFLEAIHF